MIGYNAMCISPITIRRNGIDQQVPCGRCIECSNKYSRDWSDRLVYEAKRWQNVDFLTLTYDEKNCPRVPIITACYRSAYNDSKRLTCSDVSNIVIHNISVVAADRVKCVRDLLRRFHSLSTNYCKRYDIVSNPLYHYINPNLVRVDSLVPFADITDVQNWLKMSRERFARSVGYRAKLKYFVCTEYGSKSFRPHFHVVLFHNEKMADIVKYFSNSWTYGNVDGHYSVLNGSQNLSLIAKYVSKYCSKSAEFENPYIVAGILPRCKRLMSKGLASNWRERVINIISNPPETLQVRYTLYPPGYNEYLYKGFTVEYIEWLRFHLSKFYKNGNLGTLPRYISEAVWPVTFTYRYEKKDNQFVRHAVKKVDNSNVLRTVYKNHLQLLRLQSDLIRQDIISAGVFNSTLSASRQVYSENLAFCRSRCVSAVSKYSRSNFKQFVSSHV